MEKPIKVAYRTPMISRTAIFPRKPVDTSVICYESCKLCDSFIDCQGNCLESFDSIDNLDCYRVLFVSKDFENWGELVEIIWSLDVLGVLLRLITDTELPQEVLWAASYNCKNILQINLDMTQAENDMNWVRKLMGWSNSCGLFSVIFLYPIIPTIVRTYQVVDVMDSLRNYGCHHFSLKFSKLSGCKSFDDGVCFHGKLIPLKYLTSSECFWECSSRFMEEFMEKINIYSIPRKISVSICGKSQDCTGLGG